MKIILGIVLGMRHMCQRDLKPANILLDDRLEVEICDFGCAKLMISNTTLTSNYGSPLYGTREVNLVMKIEDQSKLDIFSFEMILYEICYNPSDILFGPVKLYQRRKCPTLDNQVWVNVQEQISQCWGRNPKVRPSSLVGVIQF